MAIRIPFVGKTSPTGQANPPYAGSGPNQDDQQPFDQLVGHTTPEPDPGIVRPQPGPPIGQSGRANFHGLPQPDELNPQLVGPTGLRLLDEMYRTDAHVRRLVLAAWSPIVAGTWTLEPYGGEDATDADRTIAETIWWMLTEWMSPNFTEHLHTLGPVLLRSGFAPFEQIWAPVKHNGKTLLGPRKLDIRLPRTIWRWWQDDYGELTYIGQILPNKPDVTIPATNMTYYRLAAEGDNWQGTSLLRHCYKHWVLKDRLERIDAIGQERKAVGVPIVYHSNDVDEKALNDLETAVANMHMSEVAYLMVPGRKMGLGGNQATTGGKEFLIDVVKFDSSSGPGISQSIEYHQMAISSSFLADFLELGHHQVGARATAEVQEDPFITAISGALLPPVIPPLNRLADRIRKLNWDSSEGSPTFKLTLHDDASLTEISSFVQQLAMSDPPAIQVDPDLEDWLRERAGLPPANAQVRAQTQAAREAALKNAAMAADGQQPGQVPPDGDAEPPNPDAPPKPGQPSPAAAKPGQQQTAPAKPAAKAEPAPPSKTLDAPTSEPTAKWFERLLSQDQLRAAFDGARSHIEAAAGPAALTAARKMAEQARNGVPVKKLDPPPELVDALSRHYADMYHLGHETVQVELAKQRAALGKQLDDPTDLDLGAAAVSRLDRARQRGEHSARNIVNKVSEVLGRQQISGLKTPVALQTAAEKAATGQLHVEALSNTAASVNDGRYDSAMSSGVVGGVYTSVMDARSCDPCVAADTGDILPPDQAILLGPPNPDCEGADYCRCAIVWVLSDDPVALAAAA